METQYLLDDNNSVHKNDDIKAANVHFIWKLLAWCLGLAKWPKTNEVVGRDSKGRKSQQRRSPLHISSVSFLLVMILSAVFTLVWYVGCLLHNWGEFLRFTSYVVFYWPVIVSAQLICIIAYLTNYSNDDTTNIFQKITWSNIFNQECFWENINILHVGRILRTKREKIALLTFHGSASICCILEVRYVFKHEHGCLHWTEYICTTSNVASLLFYSTFCYFMYLNRRALQIEGSNILNYVQRNAEEEADCLAKVGKYFKRYLELRKILFPWINMITFSTTFGVTVFFTWDPNKSHSSNIVVSSDGSDGIFGSWFHHSGICQVTCGNSSDHNDGSENMEHFIVMVICEKVTVVTLALMAVGAMDVRYMWEDFQIKFNLVVYTSGKVGNLSNLRKFVNNLRVHSASSSLATFVFPLFGIVCGILSEKHFSIQQ